MTYTFEQFKNFTPVCKTFAVFGNPVSHSLSPDLHREFGAVCSKDFDYIRVEVNEDEFSGAMKIAREKLAGFNCTMPFKKMVIPFLDERDAMVSALGCANTVNVSDGRLYGYNTDGAGLVHALSLNGVTLTGKHLVILGCGGAALSIAYEASKSCEKITCAVRSSAKGSNFVETLRNATGRDLFFWVKIDDLSDCYDILINTTPVGMRNDKNTPVNLNSFTHLSYVYDCIYNPPMTNLLLDAESMGLSWDNGLSMLVLQGAYAEKHWNDVSFSDEVLRTVIEKVRITNVKSRLTNVWGRSNIALTGFMGCGKTTTGQKLAELLDMDFLDMDALIESQQKMKISDIFEKYGEMYFRDLESRACLDCIHLKNTVIATGGGTVIRDQNAEILKKNSLIVFLNQTLEQIERNLQGSKSRPLLMVNNVKEHIRSLYDFRQPQYLEKSDISINFPGNTMNPAQYVLKQL